MAGKHMFRALKSRNFRLFFVGQCISLIGTWLQQVAMAWVVLLLVRDRGGAAQDSAYWLGLAAFCGQIPTFFLAPLAGVLVDRWNRRRVVVVTQTLAMLQAFLLAGMVYFGTATVGWILVLAVVLGIVTAFDMPARQSFVPDLIENKQHLANAVALNASTFNAARLLGPVAAALLLAAVGPGLCFLLNGISYIAVLGALAAIKISPAQSAKHRPGLFRGLFEGVAYVAGFAPVRSVLLLVALVSIVGSSYGVVLPLLAVETLRGGAGTYGLLTAASGLGALCGAIALTMRRSVVGLGKWIAVAPALFGGGLLALSWSGAPWTAALTLVVSGFALMTFLGAANIVVQTIADEDKRGRVMSFYTLAFFGMAPLGSLLAGFLAGHYGIAAALRIGAAISLAGAAAFSLRLPRLREMVRPIYIRMGLLPEMPAPGYSTIAPPAPNVSQVRG